MFETFGFETLTPRSASLWFGLGIGMVFGILAEITRFCLRRALVGPKPERAAAGALWAVALAAALIGTQATVAAGWIEFSAHRSFAADVPVLALLVGGALFGAGMVLARGCAARLTVLSATGNLRALAVIILVAITAQATMRGVFSPLRVVLNAPTLPLPSLASLAIPLGLLGLAVAVWAAWRARLSVPHIAAGLAIGLLVPLAWVGTGLLLQDEFDPIAVEGVSFMSPLAESLFYAIASTSAQPGFGLGLVIGVLLGAGLSAAVTGRARWQSFATPRETGRYGLGAVLMGFGGVLAGGCTLGAGLSGVASLSTHAAIAAAAIVVGAFLTERLLSASFSGSGAPSTTPAE